MSAADPFTPNEWQATTVRWLEGNHPEYLRGPRSGVTWEHRLRKALVAMSWLNAEMRQAAELERSPLKQEEYVSEVNDRVLKWNRKSHEAVVEFLAQGGHAGAMRRLKLDLPTVKTGIDGTEEIAIEFDEETLAELEEQARPKSQPSPQHELDEIIAEAEVAADPRYKVW